MNQAIITPNPKKKTKPKSCLDCGYWKDDTIWGYRVCLLTSIAGSPKRIPKECPLFGADTDRELACA